MKKKAKKKLTKTQYTLWTREKWANRQKFTLKAKKLKRGVTVSPLKVIKQALCRVN